MGAGDGDRRGGVGAGDGGVGDGNRRGGVGATVGGEVGLAVGALVGVAVGAEVGAGLADRVAGADEAVGSDLATCRPVGSGTAVPASPGPSTKATAAVAAMSTASIASRRRPVGSTAGDRATAPPGRTRICAASSDTAEAGIGRYRGHSTCRAVRHQVRCVVASTWGSSAGEWQR